ncbi:phenylacetic acid degradation protein [Saccharomonospora piscinae]|uniref:Phenylacetic acid degradation protein n=1 Tax=Saccharomonospora piscinae TaxID=687388 RepID=A0A1V9A6M0_SACPI|nr:1,2-phenylacetyl-CoA epoxidase subunit PaaE [Saccharomonospora piscinae]OQO92777.1 phenylacetic acid degradation protein [Saccharomonospora piscinae]TLW92914.1 phenylacetate-CoA oxygenase/reductase subunit PaaK [Saccharomonospora piscinae]
MTASAPSRLRTVFHPLTVADVTRLCDDAVAVTFEVPDALARDYDFRPGQSLTLRRTVDGREERRSYSVCAAEGERPRIGVREIPGGMFSSWLVHDVRPGDRLDVGTPTGTFVPEPGPAQHVFVAAGSGITPVLSILASVLRDPEVDAMLLYGNRRSDTVMFADELAELKDRCPDRLQLVHVLSREPREAELFTGRLDRAKLAELLRLVPDVASVECWWLCGPYGMVTGARELLRAHGVDDSRIRQELFFVDDVPPEPVRHPDEEITGEASEVTVTLDGRASTVAVERTSAILDGVQRVRPDLPFACKGGVCGTCRARVVDGEVRMRRNFALEDAEVAQGFVLTCQARPVSDVVRLDYDA